MKGGVSGIEMRVNDIFGAGGIALEARKLSGDFFEIRDWMEMNRHLFSALKLEKVAMFAILLLIIIVAVFNIASTLIMIVMEKGKEIAINPRPYFTSVTYMIKVGKQSVTDINCRSR